MGEYFHEEDPYEIDFDRNFGIKDKLDAILFESIVAELEEDFLDRDQTTFVKIRRTGRLGWMNILV